MKVIFITVAFSIWVRMRVSMTMSFFFFVILIQIKLSCRSIRNIVWLFVFGVFVLIFWYQEFLRIIFSFEWFLRFLIFRSLWRSFSTQITFTALIYFCNISFRFDRLLSIVDISWAALCNGWRLLRFDRLLTLSLRIPIFNCWRCRHRSLNVMMILLDLCIAWIPLCLRLNIKKSFGLCFKFSKSFQLSPIILKILLLSQVSLHLSFLLDLVLLVLLDIWIILVHVPLLKFLSILHSSFYSLLIFNLILFKLIFEFNLLLFNKFDLHG